MMASATRVLDGVDHDEVAEIFAELTVEAAVAVMCVYVGQHNAREKADKSFVCDADEKAEAIILRGLAERLPHIPVVAEEAASRGDKPRCGRAFILVDPVDGTREFLHRNDEFTVNIALIVDGIPRAGAVYAPALGRMWMAGDQAYAFFVEPGAPFRRVRNVARSTFATIPSTVSSRLPAGRMPIRRRRPSWRVCRSPSGVARDLR